MLSSLESTNIFIHSDIFIISANTTFVERTFVSQAVFFSVTLTSYSQ
ncbi:MAG: hypothetical protein LBC61_01445 [Candidatus Peribacteria bacterium]|nr:hypothetical protein [Candidatus Peribacteria bacterium]